MLQEIYVENFTLMKSLHLPLSQGFNALSGETGAGKSLLIDAISLIIGGRGSEDFIRSGQKRCLVEGVFTAPFPEQLQDLLTEKGHEIGSDDLVLTRELNRSGKSVARINGRVVNLSFLRTIGRMLVNIHGQMEHMLILEEEHQLQLLDSFGGRQLLAVKKQLADCYHSYQKWQKKLQDYEKRQQEALQKVDFLSYQIKEIEEARLSPGEEETLTKKLLQLTYAEELQESAARGYEFLNGQQRALEYLAETQQELKNIYEHDEDFLEIYERLSNAYYEVEDIARELNSYGQKIIVDHQALLDTEERLTLIKDLEKKYGTDIDEILQFALDAQQELEKWQNWEEDGKTAAQELEKEQNKCLELAQKLSSLRKLAAEELSHAITTELQLLSMPQAIFKVQLVPQEISAQGLEKVTFMIQANVGEKFKSVEKTASGGELSRIILAIKVILAQLDQVPTLIFDEVDSGLGGMALERVTERIKKIAQYAQVLTITHAPLMAAAATHHLHIYKEVSAGKTIIKCEVLDKNRRIQELARMIAGEKITDSTIKQAKEWIEGNV